MAEYVIQGETLTEIADAIREKKYKKSQYTRLEYIESNGTQYIDTGYYVTSEKLKIVSRFMLTELKTWAALWGIEGSADKTLALTPLLNGSNNLTFYSGSSSQRGAIPVTTGKVYNLTCQTINGAITYDCNGVTGTTTADGALCKTDSFYIFTLNSANDEGILSQASKMRLYSFQMYDNDVLVLDLVPCVYTDGTLGLYDLVNEVFYTNMGTGTFAAGAEVGIIQDELVPIPTTSMAEEILALGTSWTPVLQSKTVSPSTSKLIVRRDPGYDGLEQVTVNAMPTAEQATPGISVDSNGLITASATQEAGYVAAGTKSAKKQLTTQTSQIITPRTYDQTIDSGRYIVGVQTIKGDSNLAAGNIKKGVSIFGVTGTYEGSTVQRKNGAFSEDANGQATVSCGFKPDCVAVYGGVFGGEPVYAGAMFAEGSEETLNIVVAPPNHEYLFTILTITRTDDGFTVYAEKTAGNYFQSPETDRIYNYTALKYT